jgi:Zn-dependent protease
MKTLTKITVINIIPAYTFSAAEQGGIDMKAYSEFAGYGFLILLAVFFSIFLYYALHPSVYIPREITVEALNSQDRLKMQSTVNAVYYSILILMVIYAVILIIQIL